MQTPPKPNYQRELEQTLSTIPAGTKPHLFLHACCAPCSSYVLEYLSRYFTITIYFYNPNIMPEAEFSHRLAGNAIGRNGFCHCRNMGTRTVSGSGKRS